MNYSRPYTQGTSPLAPMSSKEAAAYIGVSVRTLEKWRSQEDQTKNPPYVMHKGRPWYRQDTLDRWLKSVWAKVNTPC